MTINKIKNGRFINCFNCITVLTIIVLTAFAISATAQSTDPLSPTPMTTDTIKSRWGSGKRISHYYSFTGGPGIVKVQLNIKPDDVDSAYGALMDGDGHYLIPVENRNTTQRARFGDVLSSSGSFFVATYEIKRKQNFIFEFFTDGIDKDTGGSYTFKVSGDGISFNGNKGIVVEDTGKDKTLGLPKSGKLRLVMDDGTVQEINLTRVREATVKP